LDWHPQCGVGQLHGHSGCGHGYRYGYGYITLHGAGSGLGLVSGGLGSSFGGGCGSLGDGHPQQYGVGQLHGQAGCGHGYEYGYGHIALHGTGSFLVGFGGSGLGGGLATSIFLMILPALQQSLEESLSASKGPDTRTLSFSYTIFSMTNSPRSWMQQRTFWILVLQRQHSRSTVMMSVGIPSSIRKPTISEETQVVPDLQRAGSCYIR